MGFSRQQYWSGLPCPPPGIKPKSPALQADSLPSEPLGKPCPSLGLSNYEITYHLGSETPVGKKERGKSQTIS